MIWRYISHKLAISENMLERFVVRLYCELTTVEKMLEFLYSKYNSLSSCDYFFFCGGKSQKLCLFLQAFALSKMERLAVF